ncbi:hypothetical protein CGRA01v4_02604 [Colletotrichum graminicola]|nr:hypothetical protein CGRA01v4_02604 [Colletotrichum graminicola]
MFLFLGRTCRDWISEHKGLRGNENSTFQGLHSTRPPIFSG